MAHAAKDRPGDEVRAPAQQQQSQARFAQARHPVPRPRRGGGPCPSRPRPSRDQESDEVASPASNDLFDHSAYVGPPSGLHSRTRTPVPAPRQLPLQKREELGKPSASAAAGNVNLHVDLHVDEDLAASVGLPPLTYTPENDLKHFSSFAEFETCLSNSALEEDDRPQVYGLSIQETRPDATSALVPGVPSRATLNYHPAM